MSLATRATRGAVWLSIATVINIVIGFAGGILLARLLNPNDFGTFGLAVTICSFADVRTRLQFDQKFLQDQAETAERFSAFLTLSSFTSLVSLVLILFVAFGATKLNRPDLAICLAVIGFLNVLESVSSCIRVTLEKRVAFQQVALIQNVASLCQIGVNLIAALVGFGLWSLLFGTATSILINLIAWVRITPHRLVWHLDRAIGREFITYGIKYGLVYSASSVILTQLDNLTIGLLGGTLMLGFYDRAYRTSLWPTLLISASLGRVSLPTYAILQDDFQRLSKAFSFSLWTVLTFATPISLVFLATAPELVPALYGDKWLPSVPILQVLAAFAIFRPLWDDLISILVATKRQGQMAHLVFIQASVLGVLVVPLTWVWGGIGTAISVGLAFMISASYLLYFGKTHLKIDLRDVAFMPLANNLIALGIYSILQAYLTLTAFSPLYRLGIEIFLLLGLYLLVSLLTSGRTILNRMSYIYSLARGK